MRTVSFVLAPDRGYLDPCEVAFRRNGVVPRYVHNLDVLADDSVVMSYEVSGSREAIHDSLADAGETLLGYEVVDAGETNVIQIHYRPCDLVVTLLEIHDSWPTLFQFPHVYLEGDRTRLRHDLFGPDDAVSEQISETRRRVDVSVRRLGAYEPARDRLGDELTERQREVFQAALEAGYYEIPRDATHADLATELDCSASTVGRHLRHIEATLASRAAPDVAAADSTEEPAD